MVTVVDNTVLFNWNLLEHLKVFIKKKRERELCEVMGMVTYYTWELFHKSYVYQIIILYTSDTSQLNS